ncbi:hypothetical protein ACLVWU_08980 [Bdellovibrio sp. HCB290]|uniref:hypothetical protein n=1 Tax=Bdellovibrio sp. HCB290 TaxID=3394356 RepID=UPI0039B6AF0D
MRAFVLMFLLFPALATATVLNCEYSFYGAPAGTVRIDVSEDGTPGPVADVSLFYTPTQQAPVTIQEKNAGELFNVVLFKDNPQNEIFMTVNLAENDGSFKSKIINPKLTGVSKEIPGTCKF